MISVFGLGFVGLTTALGFAHKGFHVSGFDINEMRMGQLRNKSIPFHEPHLEETLHHELDRNFKLAGSLKEAVEESSILFLCVGTPSLPDGSADLSFIKNVIGEIVKYSLDKKKIIVIKSTVPPSTLSNAIKPHLQKLAGTKSNQFALASNPEFLREGYAWNDFMNPDRIVIGTDNPNEVFALQDIYSVFNAPVHMVSSNSAEFIKYLSNTLLSTMISFANEMSMIAGHVGDIDIHKSFKILHEDKRWIGSPAPMSSYLFPGCGYGGYCLPKDTMALASVARQHGFTAQMLEANLDTNEKIGHYVVQKIADTSKLNDTIGILGLSFKPGSDDVRLSPSKRIIELLLARGYTSIVAYDPLANDVFDKEHQLPVTYATSLGEIVDKASLLVLLTGWSEFRENKNMIEQKPVLNFRYLWPDDSNLLSSSMQEHQHTVL